MFVLVQHAFAMAPDGMGLRAASCSDEDLDQWRSPRSGGRRRQRAHQTAQKKQTDQVRRRERGQRASGWDVRPGMAVTASQALQGINDFAIFPGKGMGPGFSFSGFTPSFDLRWAGGFFP